MSKISSIVLYILAGISIVLAGLFFFGPRATFFGTDNVPVFFDENLAWAAILLVITVVLTFFFGIEFLVTHPKSLKGAGIGILSALVLVGVAYFLASDAPIPGAKEETSALTLKWVDVGLFVTYILGGIAVFGLVFSEVYKAIK